MFVNARRVLAIVVVSLSAFVALTANAVAAKEVEYEMCGQVWTIGPNPFWNCGTLGAAAHLVVYKGLYTDLSEDPHGTGTVEKEKGGRIRLELITPNYLQGSYWQFVKAGCAGHMNGCYKHAYLLESGMIRRERGFDEWEEEPITPETVLLVKVS